MTEEKGTILKSKESETVKESDYAWGPGTMKGLDIKRDAIRDEYRRNSVQEGTF